MDKNTFFRSAALFRRRRRRAYGGYDIYHENEKDQIQINISKTEGYEDFYTFTPTKQNNISPSEQEEKTISKINPYYVPKLKEGQENKAKDKQSTKTKWRQKKDKGGKLKNPNETIDYVDENGKKYTKRGGTISWRANNPGNLSFTTKEGALKSGAIGVKSDGKGHNFAIYKSYEEGRKAMKKKLDERRFSVDEYGNEMPISNMIAKLYAPKEDGNRPDLYAKFLAEATGIDVYNRSWRSLKEKEKTKIMDAIEDYEEFTEGVIER